MFNFNITDEQKELLLKYIENPSDDIDELLEQIDDKILDIGFEKNWDYLNEVGVKLQRLYDDLYWQNLID